MRDGEHAGTGEGGALSVLLPVVRSLRSIAVFAFGVGVLTAIFVLIVKPRYEVTVSLLPASQPAPGAALGLLGSMAASELALGMQEMGPDRYVDILKSQRVFTNVATRMYHPSDGTEARNLIALYEYTSLHSGEAVYYTVEKLRKKADISISRVTGLITIIVEDTDPAVAAQMAQAFVDELINYTQNVFATTSHLRSEFFKRRVVEIGDSLRAAEAELLRFSEQNMNIGLSPRLNLLQERLVRQVEFYKELHLSLSVEYERARGEEIRQQLIVNVLDDPRTPSVRAWPRRTMTVLLAMIVAAALGVVCAYGRELLLRERASPEGKDVLGQLRTSIRDQFRRKRPRQ